MVELVQPELSLRWDLHDIAGHLGTTLQNAENAFRLEHAVFGLDALDDLRLHQLVVRGLSATCMAQREVWTPATAGKRRNLRIRADLVLTPPSRPLRTSDEPDLFTPPDACPPEEALWLNLRVLRQFPPLGVAPVSYDHAWRSAVALDLVKLTSDPRVTESGLAAVIFSDTPETLAQWVQSLDEDLARAGVTPADSASQRHVRTVPITDRLGHRYVSIVIWSATDPHPAIPHRVVR